MEVLFERVAGLDIGKETLTCYLVGVDPSACRRGVPKAQIASRLGISRATVIKAVASDAPPKYERKDAPRSFTPVEPAVLQLLADWDPDPQGAHAVAASAWLGRCGRRHGLVTSIVRAQQPLMERIDAALRPLELSFARYEILPLFGLYPVRFKRTRRGWVGPPGASHQVDQWGTAAGLAGRNDAWAMRPTA